MCWPFAFFWIAVAFLCALDVLKRVQDRGDRCFCTFWNTEDVIQVRCRSKFKP
jgi:hypothetical protein